MALASLSRTLSFASLSTFTNLTSTPFCSIPTTSLNPNRIASITGISPDDCGTCIEICVPSAASCTDVLLVDSVNSFSPHPETTTTNTNTTNTNTTNTNTTSEIGIHARIEREPQILISTTNPLSPSVGAPVHASVLPPTRCQGIWNGDLLGDGNLPLGKFAELMLLADARETKKGTEKRGRRRASVADGVGGSTELKPAFTMPVFRPPTGAEYMVDTGYLARKNGGTGRIFSK